MDPDLAFREARIGWRGVVALVGAGGAAYAAVDHSGIAAVMGIAGLTVGYVLAYVTKSSA